MEETVLPGSKCKPQAAKSQALNWPTFSNNFTTKEESEVQ